MASRNRTQSATTGAADNTNAADAMPSVAELNAANEAAALAGADQSNDFTPADFDHAEDVKANSYEIHAESMIEGALFVARPNPERKEGAPQMTGTIRIDGSGLRVPFAGFVTTAKETGELYLRLSVGVKDGPRYYGRLFNTHTDGTSGADYFGYLALLPVTAQNQYTKEEWDAAPTLRLRGLRRRNATSNTARIQIFGAPIKVGAHELPI